MPFPIQIQSSIELSGNRLTKTVTLNSGITVLLGPNGSGKTHLMRGMKADLAKHCSGKKVRFLSAGRVGLFEQYRSDYDGHRGDRPLYQQANYGSLSDTARRHNYETLQGDFQTLAMRPDILIKIRERLRKLFGRDILVLWDGGNLKIEFIRTIGGSGAYSSAREASGLLHLAGLLTALYDDEVGAVLIDEPEVSLHPQLQAFLLKEMLAVAGQPDTTSNKKFVIIGTHSTEFIRIESPSDLPSLVFCYDLAAGPVQVAQDAEELKSQKLLALIARMGQEHKLAFFAKSPLLVEGPSDTIICGGLASRLELHLEAGGSQLLPVIGKGQFPIVVKLLRMLGKEPLVLTDADGLADGLDLANCFLMNADANARAAKLGFGSAIELSRSVYGAFCKQVKEDWESVSTVAEAHPYWKNRDQAKPDEEAKRRAVISVLFENSDDVIAKLGVSQGWITVKQRMAALLDLLESQGCFVLRRGTIESYYFSADAVAVTDKPAAAAEEIATVRNITTEAIEDRYGDVLRCLRQASSTEKIVEAESLQDLLLAVAAPAVARIMGGCESAALNGLARNTVGTHADLFELGIVDGKLSISLKSKVLDVPGFPMSIAVGDDVVKAVSTALGLAKS